MFSLRLTLVLFLPVVVMVIMMGVIGVVILVLVVVVIRVVVRVDAVIRFLPARLGMLPVRLAKRYSSVITAETG